MNKKIILMIATLVSTSDAMAWGYGYMPEIQPSMASQYGMSGGAIGFGGPGMYMPQMPGIGIAPPPRINPENYNMPPPQYQTYWNGDCMCYRPFQPGY